MDFLTLLIICAVLATVGALASGIASMVLGGTYDQKHSNPLMRMRVSLQGVALVLALLALLVAAL